MGMAEPRQNQNQYKVVAQKDGRESGDSTDDSKRGHQKRTLVFRSSDNGAIGAGSSKPVSGRQFSHYEGRSSGSRHRTVAR